MPIEARELGSLAELAALEPEWRALWNRDPRATPFQSPDWLLPWTRHLWGGGQIRALGFWREGRLCALAPFFEWGIGARCLSFLGSGITDYLDTLAELDFAHEAAGRIFEWIEKDCAHCETIDLQELPAGSPLVAAAPQAWQRRECSLCPVVALPTDLKLPPDVHRAENRLEKSGARASALPPGFRPAQCATAQEIPLLEHLFRLHSLRWRERHDNGVLANSSLQAFHREAAQRFQQTGGLRLFGLFVDSRCIAVQYNLSAKHRTYAYLSGFDPEWSRFSPGAVLLKHSIRHAVEEGSLEFDFLRRPEPFKYLWGARDRINRRLVLSRAARAEVA